MPNIIKMHFLNINDLTSGVSFSNKICILVFSNTEEYLKKNGWLMAVPNNYGIKYTQCMLYE